MVGRKTRSGVEGYHEPVLLREVIEILSVKEGSWYLDCTLGDGGHSLEILRRGGKVVGIDVDPQALERVKKRFKDEGLGECKYILLRGNFREINNLIAAQMDNPRFERSIPKGSTLKERPFLGCVFDLGVSSLQLESPERGFSFATEGPLDMRMDPELRVRALDLINVLSRKELYELFSKLGEEKFAWAVAKALVSAREVKPLNTTRDLAEVVESVVGRKHGRIPAYAKASAGKHPATRVFQALRIAVNDELNTLKEGLDQVKDLVKNNGSILVISFHSLEDRIVKTTFRKWQFEGLGQILTKKPIRPSEDEISNNPRARSAKIRVFRYDYH